MAVLLGYWRVMRVALLGVGMVASAAMALWDPWPGEL